MKNIIISAFADEYSKDFDIQVKMLSENCIPSIEPRFIGGKNISVLTPDEVRAIREKLDFAGISVYSVGSPLGKIALDGDVAAHMETARNTFEGANILGAKNVRVFSFYTRQGKSIGDCRDEVIERVGELTSLADSFGLTLCHENEADIYGESPEACLELIKATGGKLKAVFDMGNFLLCGFDPMAAYELLGDHIKYFHIKDALPNGAIVPPGCGEAHIGEILSRHIKRADDDITVTLEPHLETFSGLNAIAKRNFHNPYRFESSEEAFLTALHDLRGIIDEISK